MHVRVCPCVRVCACVCMNDRVPLSLKRVERQEPGPVRTTQTEEHHNSACWDLQSGAVYAETGGRLRQICSVKLEVSPLACVKRSTQNLCLTKSSSIIKKK